MAINGGNQYKDIVSIRGPILEINQSNKLHFNYKLTPQKVLAKICKKIYLKLAFSLRIIKIINV